MTDQADTPDPIGEWLALCDKATPGEWEFWPGTHGDPLVAQTGRGPFGAVAMCSTSPPGDPTKGWGGGLTDYGRANAEFIAASRNVVPAVRALVAEVRALRAENERLTDCLTEVRAEAEQIRESRQTYWTALLTAADERDSALAELAAARDLLGKIVDPDPCWFDHNGDCQAHGWTIHTPDGLCGHEHAKRLLAALSQSEPTKETP